MRVVVLGATGNVGTDVVRLIAGDSRVTSVVGVARRMPEWGVPKTEWVAADVTDADLTMLFRGADAVVHLAWLFQPARRPMVTWRVNVEGSANVFRAVAAARVPVLVYASSVGAYSPGPGARRVDESWPTHGWPQAAYTREKAYVERLLDVFEIEHPECRVVRMRPAFTFKRESATQQRRLFAGPFLPGRLARTKVMPDLPGLRLQAVHTADVAEAYRRALMIPIRGAFNLAADPVLDPPELAELLNATLVRVPIGLARAGTAVAWALRLVPVPVQLFDAALRMPVMDTSRAHAELDWSPRRSSTEAIQEFLTGLREGAGTATAPLAPDSGITGRIREVATGVGRRT